MILESKENGVFNVAGEEEFLRDWHPCNGPTKYLDFISLTTGYRRSNIASNRLRLLGWNPRYSIVQGLRSCISPVQSSSSLISSTERNSAR